MEKNRRIIYFIGFISILIIEILIALFIHDKIIRPYIGDILVIICIFLLFKTIFDNKVKHLAIYILIFAVIVELMQYFNIVQYLVKDNRFLKIVFGTTFDIRDIICYMIGYVIILIFENKIFKQNNLKYEW